MLQWMKGLEIMGFNIICICERNKKGKKAKGRYDQTTFDYSPVVSSFCFIIHQS